MDIEEYAKKHPKVKGASLSPEILEGIEKLPKGSKILDVGCAEGLTIKELYSIFKGKYHYTGVDLSKTRIKSANRLKILNSKFVVATGEDMPFKNASFDCILSSQVLEHVDNEKMFLSEISRLLKSRGIFQIDTVFKKKWAWYFYKSPVGWALDPTHLREYTDLDKVKRLFRKAHLITDDVYITQVKRNLSKIIPLKLEINIPGYYTLFILGRK